MCHMIMHNHSCDRLTINSAILLSVFANLTWFFRTTLQQSPPNKAGLKCPYMRTYVSTSSIRPQKVSFILVKFGIRYRSMSDARRYVV